MAILLIHTTERWFLITFTFVLAARPKCASCNVAAACEPSNIAASGAALVFRFAERYRAQAAVDQRGGTSSESSRPTLGAAHPGVSGSDLPELPQIHERDEGACRAVHVKACHTSHQLIAQLMQLRLWSLKTRVS